MKLCIGGIRVRISFLFCALLCLIVLFDNGYVLPTFLSVCAHEGAHLFAMLLCQAEVESVHLEAFGVLIHQKNGAQGFWKNLCIITAGCALNLLLCICFYVAWRSAQKQLLLRFSAVNAALFLMNALPVAGLDGAAALRLLLETVMEAETAAATVKIVSYICCACLFVFVMIVCFKIRFNPSLCLFSLYLLFQTAMSGQDSD